MTARYRFLVYLSGFLLLANLLVMNDFTSLWGGAESWLAWRSLSGESGLAPHELFMGWIMGEGPIPHFWIRLPGVVIFILSLALYWGITQRLFGAEVLRSTLLILSASLLLPNWLQGSAQASFPTAGPGNDGGILKTLHHAPKAKRIIYLFQSGGPSQIELFDYKPELVKRNGQDCPAEFLKGKNFAFTSGTPPGKVIRPRSSGSRTVRMKRLPG